MNIHEYPVLHPVPLSLSTGKKINYLSRDICRDTSTRGRQGRKEEGTGRNGREVRALYQSASCVCEWD